MKNIKLDEFISIEDFVSNPETCKFLGYSSSDLYLPTECYIEEPTMVMPKIARAFLNIDLYVRNRRVLDYNEIVDEDKRNNTDFKGTYKETPLMLFEIWEDSGSDGHVHYVHLGYMFCRDIKIEGKKYPEELNTKYLDWYFSERCKNV